MNVFNVIMILVMALSTSCSVFNERGTAKKISAANHSFILCSEEPENPDCVDGTRDCNGEPNGSAEFDACEVCDGDGMSCLDCNGTPNGGDTSCNDCGEDGTSCSDCRGVLYGVAEYDECNVCEGDGTSCIDCSGTPNGGDNSCLDCRGVQFGTALVDTCGVCQGNGSTCIASFPKDPATRNITFCTSHKGKPYPWEGTGACTGNSLITIPIGTTGQSITQNSIDPIGNYGFGMSGFRLALDKRLYTPEAIKVTTEEGDGSYVHFVQTASGVYAPEMKILSKSRISKVALNYVETLRNGTKLNYSPIALLAGTYGLSSVVRANGSTVTIERNTAGNITTITVPHNKVITFDYNPDGFVETINFPGNIRYTLQYSGARLAQVIYPNTNSNDFLAWNLDYASGSNRVVKLTDTSRAATINNYDSNGMLTDTTSSEGQKITYTHVTGLVITRGFEANAEEYFNQYGIMNKSVKNNLPTLISRNSTGFLRVTRDYLGRNTTYNYQLQKNGDIELVELGLPNKKLLSFQYDDYGNIKYQRETSTASGALRSFETTYTYDSANRLLTKSGPGQYSKANTYTNGNLTNVVVNGQTVLSRTYDNNNRLISRTVKGQTTTINGFDSYGNPTDITTPMGVVSMSSTPSGLVESVTQNGHKASTIHDAVGRPIQKSITNLAKPANAYEQNITYGATSITTTDNRGNGLAGNYYPDGSSSQFIDARGISGEGYVTGQRTKAPVYTNPK